MCVFLEYSDQHKDCMCLYPPAGGVYLRIHVLLNEASFPFSDKYRELVSSPLTPFSQAWLINTKKIAEVLKQ